MRKSRSYPECLKKSHERKTREEKDEMKKLQNDVKLHTETINAYREKDQSRTEQLADLGSSSSIDITIHIDWRQRCCRSLSNAINFFLEREEETRRQDKIIQQKSYAGFYYFIKWFIRAFFFLVFTTLGTIGGKEIGCEIKDHDICESDLIELADSSPHIVATILGFIFGLIIGQWVGRVVWDKMTMSIRHCLRRLEKKADRSKAWLFLTSLLIYVIITIAFSLVFLFCVDLGIDDENIIGGVVGGIIGLFLAIIAYRKSSSCRAGQTSDTPMLTYQSSMLDVPQIIV